MAVNLRHLEVFHAIMSSASLTEAARRLNVSQPAVSTMLKHMEAQLGLKLFERVAGRLHATPEADILFGDVDGIFARIATLRRMTSSLRDGRTGSLAIAATPTLADTLLPRAIARFRESRPNVTLQVMSLPTTQVIDRVERREADFGLAYGLASSGGTETELIGHSRVACVMRAGHPLAALDTVTPADLAPYDVISPGPSTPIGELIVRCFQQAGQPLSLAVDVTISMTGCVLAYEGAGVALIDPAPLRIGVFPGLVARPFEPALEVALVLLFPRDRPRSRLARQFETILRAVLTEPQAGPAAVQA